MALTQEIDLLNLEESRTTIQFEWNIESRNYKYFKCKTNNLIYKRKVWLQNLE
jgi:hypothetical protein